MSDSGGISPGHLPGGGAEMGGIPGRTTVLLTGLPVTIAVCVLLGWWLGSIADRHFGTGWVFQTAGVLLGAAAAVRDAAVQIGRLMDEEGRASRRGDESGKNGGGRGGE